MSARARAAAPAPTKPITLGVDIAGQPVVVGSPDAVWDAGWTLAGDGRLLLELLIDEPGDETRLFRPEHVTPAGYRLAGQRARGARAP